jgi:hypothetical protein
MGNGQRFQFQTTEKFLTSQNILKYNLFLAYYKKTKEYGRQHIKLYTNRIFSPDIEH